MKIFVLSGAGLSAESGLGTFRDVGGLWSKYDLEDVATPEGFAKDPQLVHEFYNARRRNLLTAEPNPAHFALAKLQRGLREKSGDAFVVTQNVDDLLERAGVDSAIHMHGELLRAKCDYCGARCEQKTPIHLMLQCKACGAVGGMRPDVVWFGEMPYHLDRITDLLMQADRFVSIGTSGSVYPAAGFVAEAQAAGIPCTELNLEPSDNFHMFSSRIYGPASETTPQWVDEILSA